MSAYVVDNKTISAMVKAFDVYEVSYKAENYVDTNPFKSRAFIDASALRHDIGQSLLDQNYKSVNYRYNEDTPTPNYKYEDVEIDEGIVYGCIRCYNYQACETDDYFESEIYKSLERLKTKMFERLIRRCGMNTEGWGYPEEPIPDDYEPEEPDVVEVVTANGDIKYAPNYDKFEGWDTLETLMFLNMD